MNPFKVGDKVMLRSDVMERHARSIPAYMGYNTQQFAWRATLRSLLNVVGTITHIFPNSTNVKFDNKNTGIGIAWMELVAHEAKK